MNMGDEVTGTVVMVSGKVAEIGVRTIADIIGKLLHYLAAIHREHKANKKLDVHNNDITDIKSGKVSSKELTEYCLKNGIQYVTSENGFSSNDASYMAAQAKKSGIPIAFYKNKDKSTIYAYVRQSDLPIFKKIATDTVINNMKTRPEDLGNYKCSEWEIPFLISELKECDLAAQFAKTRNGDYLCVYEKLDEKSIKFAREQFLKKCTAVENEVQILDNDEDGNTTIKNLLTGHEISISGVPNKREVAIQFQNTFGYDENKANIAAAKIGQELFKGDDKIKYFADDPTAEFSYISQVTWDNEDPLTKPYECYYVNTRLDGKSKIAFMYNDEERQREKFVILDPPNQSKQEMRNEIKKMLGVTDIREQDALIAKAEHISQVNAKYRGINGEIQDLHEHNMDFSDNDEVGIDSISTNIERKNSNFFEIESTVKSADTNMNGTKKLSLSFSNKKNAIQQLKELYVSQGVSDKTAKEMAKNVYRKAELQSAEPLIAVEEKAFADLSNISLLISTQSKAIETISKKYGVPYEQAETIYNKYKDNAENTAQHVKSVYENKTDYNTAMNRMTKREQNKYDSMVVCCAANPERHIVVSGSHNGDRVVHNYNLYNGQNNIGNFTDAHTTDAKGNAVIEENGKHAWTNLKNDMSMTAGISNDVLIFDSKEEYQNFMMESEFIEKFNEATASAESVENSERSETTEKDNKSERTEGNTESVNKNSNNEVIKENTHLRKENQSGNVLNELHNAAANTPKATSRGGR
ncbi:MAG: hypothetical protein IKW90_15800 [Lachnospiraceae bacterium]|nr:hypothetical protein [Lachnospiraceae bacterium]